MLAARDLAAQPQTPPLDAPPLPERRRVALTHPRRGSRPPADRPPDLIKLGRDQGLASAPRHPSPLLLPQPGTLHLVAKLGIRRRLRPRPRPWHRSASLLASIQ